MLVPCTQDLAPGLTSREALTLLHEEVLAALDAEERAFTAWMDAPSETTYANHCWAKVETVRAYGRYRQFVQAAQCP